MELSAPMLRAEGVRRSHGEATVLDAVQLEVHRGEVLALLGPNGAGKSTLFRILMLLERPDSGVVYVGGRAARPGDRMAALRLAGVFQRAHLFAGTVMDNVAFGLRARGASTADRVRRSSTALASMKLEPLAKRDVRTLSGGEAQRVAVARALAVEPDVLLLDEPTAGLDTTIRRHFREDLERAVRRRAGGVLLITHDPADAFALADRIAVLEAGRVVQTGSPADLVLAPATPFVATFTGAELLLDGTVDTLEAGLVRIRTPSGAGVWGVAAEPLTTGAVVHASYRPEDITLVATDGETPTSAINRFRARIVSVVTTGALVRVRLDAGIALTATVTRRSADALRLGVGLTVDAHVKASAVRVFPVRPDTAK